MGLIMNVSTVINQLEAMNVNLNNINTDLNGKSEKISNFLDTKYNLVGESYDSERQYYEVVHIPILRGMILCTELMLQENESYKNCIQTYLKGIGNINEDELKKDRDIIEQEIVQVSGMMKVSSASLSSYMSCLQQALKQVEKKLNQINGFKMASAGFYLEMYSYFIM